MRAENWNDFLYTKKGFDSSYAAPSGLAGTTGQNHIPSAISIAKYFLAKDPERRIFVKASMTQDCRAYGEGATRMNEYLHLAQNIYIAKEGERLFAEDLCAHEDSVVVPVVHRNYAVLVARSDVPELPASVRTFLDQIYDILKDATLDELLELSHEDDEWVEKHGISYKAGRRMDPMSRQDTYRQQYSDILAIMARQ